MTDHPDARTDGRALKRARARAEQAERDARRMRDQLRRWQEEGTRLTRAEFEAGVPCRGCGKPWLDGLGRWPPLLEMTLEQRAEYDREDARYLGVTVNAGRTGRAWGATGLSTAATAARRH
jgi:hypothetical protein